jgi:hypothetical protein
MNNRNADLHAAINELMLCLPDFPMDLHQQLINTMLQQRIDIIIQSELPNKILRIVQKLQSIDCILESKAIYGVRPDDELLTGILSTHWGKLFVSIFCKQNDSLTETASAYFSFLRLIYKEFESFHNAIKDPSLKETMPFDAAIKILIYVVLADDIHSLNYKAVLSAFKTIEECLHHEYEHHVIVDKENLVALCVLVDDIMRLSKNKELYIELYDELELEFIYQFEHCYGDHFGYLVSQSLEKLYLSSVVNNIIKNMSEAEKTNNDLFSQAEDITLEGIRFHKINLTNRDFIRKNVIFKNCEFIECDLSESRIICSGKTTFTKTNLENTHVKRLESKPVSTFTGGLFCPASDKKDCEASTSQENKILLKKLN